MSKEITAKEFTILVKKGTTKEGKDFNYYRAVKKDGSLMDCRFRKEVTPLPTVKSIISVPLDAWNIATNREYPTLWVSAINDTVPVQSTFTKSDVDGDIF